MLESFILGQFNLNRKGFLPKDWKNDVGKAVDSFGEIQILNGKSVTSLEKNRNYIKIKVLDGENIKKHLPWLYDLYEGCLLNKASQLSDRKLYSSNNLKSSININLIEGKGNSYEWHVDSNPITGLLFVDNLEVEEGGQLVFKKDNCVEKIVPDSGNFIVFDARKIPHRVEPLLKETRRISIPMNYYESCNFQERPADLDDYLYNK